MAKNEYNVCIPKLRKYGQNYSKLESTNKTINLLTENFENYKFKNFTKNLHEKYPAENNNNELLVSKMKKCPSCNKQLSNITFKCPYCNYNFNEEK